MGCPWKRRDRSGHVYALSWDPKEWSWEGPEKRASFVTGTSA